MAHDVGVVIPAAGRGTRLGKRQAKALVPVAGQSLLAHTLRAFQRAPSVDAIVVVAPPSDQRRVEFLVRRHRFTKVVAVVAGADSRAGSVAKGLEALPATVKWVAIHDGARPCVTPRLIETLVRKAKQYGAVAAGLPVGVTVKAVDDAQRVRLTLDREQLWLVQTPQVFRREWIMDAVSRANGQLEHFPDDAAILEWAGFPVQMVPGDPWNIKVTTPQDLAIAEAILRTGRARSL